MIFKRIWMGDNQRKSSSVDQRIIDTIIALVIFVFTFPGFDPSLSPGLDPSYMWAYNYLFLYDYNQLTETVFPYGPLGFLKMPAAMGMTFQYAILFYCFLKVSLLYALLRFSRSRKLNTLFGISLTTLIAAVLNFDLILIGTTLLLCIQFIEKKQFEWLFGAALIACLAFCVKVSIGVSTFSILGLTVFSVLALFPKERWLFVKSMLISITVVIFLGSIIFISPFKFFDYFVHSIRLSGQFSSSLAFQADNNWLFLGLALIAITIPLIRAKNRKEALIIILLFPVLFAMWKHAMSRQDTSHVRLLYSFIYFYWAFILISIPKQRFLNLVLGILSIFLFERNLDLMETPPKIDMANAGWNSFEKIVLHMPSFLEDARKTTVENLQPLKLSSEASKLIGDKTVDVLPWELNMIPINGLNWQPKRTLQVGSFAPWLDQITIEDYKTEGPEMIIIRQEDDLKGGKLGSVDGRYLLNDNPEVYDFISRNYTEVYTDDEIVLLAKKKEEVSNWIELDWKELSWGDTLKIPSTAGNKLRLKAEIESSLLGSLRNFLYRSGGFYLNYHFENGMSIRYPFLPTVSTEGIQIKPFIRFPSVSFIEENPIAISLESDRLSDVEEKIRLCFEVDNRNDSALSLFGGSQREERIEIVSENYEFNDGTEKLNSEAFSKTFRIKLDTLWQKYDSEHLLIEAYSEQYNEDSNASLVIALDEVESGFWIPLAVKPKYQPDFTYSSKLISRSEYPEGRISVYLWNHGEKPMELYKLKIKISG